MHSSRIWQNKADLLVIFFLFTQVSFRFVNPLDFYMTRYFDVFFPINLTYLLLPFSLRVHLLPTFLHLRIKSRYRAQS